MKISVIKEKILKIEIDKIIVFYNFSTKCENISKCDILIDPYTFRYKNTDDNIFLIDSPGEYEIKDLFIKGKNITGQSKNENDSPTTFLLKYDQVKLLICDKIKDTKTTMENLKNFASEVDVVVVIIGEKNFLSPSQGQTLSRAFSPSVIIPVSIDNSKNHLKAFVSAAGGKEENQKVLKLKKKNLIPGESKVILLQ